MGRIKSYAASVIYAQEPKVSSSLGPLMRRRQSIHGFSDSCAAHPTRPHSRAQDRSDPRKWVCLRNPPDPIY